MITALGVASDGLLVRGSLPALHIGARGLLRSGGIVTPPAGGGGGMFPSFALNIARAKARRRERLQIALESVTEPTREVIEAAQSLGPLDLTEIERRIDEARLLIREQAATASAEDRARLEAIARDGVVSLDVTPSEIVRDTRNLRLLLLMGG